MSSSSSSVWGFSSCHDKTPESRRFRGGGGGWGIRTPEGLHPTRFPSVRHRPLGESSRRSTRRQPRATRKEYIGPSIPGASPGRWDLSREAGRDGSQPGAGSGSLSLGPSCGVIQRIPQDRKVARVSRLWRVREGSSRLPQRRGGLLGWQAGGLDGALHSSCCGTPRGSGSTAWRMGVLHEGPGLVQYGQLLARTPQTS